ncbi:MAG: Hsp70 family protein [Deltaproteobacteria bacterium]|nr:Hsp70 family protein [Deltaproteobacteria bacterium]
MADPRDRPSAPPGTLLAKGGGEGGEALLELELPSGQRVRLVGRRVPAAEGALGSLVFRLETGPSNAPTLLAGLAALARAQHDVELPPVGRAGEVVRGDGFRAPTRDAGVYALPANEALAEVRTIEEVELPPPMAPGPRRPTVGPPQVVGFADPAALVPELPATVRRGGAAASDVDLGHPVTAEVEAVARATGEAAASEVEPALPPRRAPDGGGPASYPLPEPEPAYLRPLAGAAAPAVRPARPPTGPAYVPRPVPEARPMPVVGIDFGTSYSSVAVLRAGLEVIPDEGGELLTPSVVSFPAPGVVLVGTEARRRIGGEAQWTIPSPKRLLGRAYKDPQTGTLLGSLALRTFAGTDKLIRFEAHGEIYSVVDVCAMVLARLKQRASRFLGAEVHKAVFTVPVAYGLLQRSALEQAARQAGLQPVALLTEPSAALLAHGFRGRQGIVAIYDFGGGTFDFSLVEVTDTAFRVLCAGGDPWLGGDDFDQAIANHLADRFWKDSGVDLRQRAVEWQALVFACEAAKRVLSSKSSARITVDNLLHTSQGTKGLSYSVSRRELEKLTAPLIERSMAVVDRVLSQVGMQRSRVDQVVMTGGTSLVPAIRDAVGRYFDRKPTLGDADLAVVRGAAIRAAELGLDAPGGASSGARKLRDVAGRTIGMGTEDGQLHTLFERDTPLPAERRHSVLTQRDGQSEMVITLYEGAKSRIDERQLLGMLRYKGLRPAPAGQRQVDFTFRLDEDGSLHVAALVEGKIHDKTIRLE